MVISCEVEIPEFLRYFYFLEKTVIFESLDDQRENIFLGYNQKTYKTGTKNKIYLFISRSYKR